MAPREKQSPKTTAFKAKGAPRPARPDATELVARPFAAKGKARAAAKPAAKAAPTAATEGERIAKVLSRRGVASRREAERLIAIGEVTVNGKVIDSPALNVTERDRITVSGQPLPAKEPVRLWLYHKPDGLVTSAADEKGRDTVFDHLPEDMPRVMSVGRLDLNSEGLLLLTNDGELKRRLELPTTGWLRRYRVRVNGNPDDMTLQPLREGITVDGESFQPMLVTLDRVQGANAWLTIGIREGKNREIRRALGSLGLQVNRLIRIAYGPFRLNDIGVGEVEEVRPRVLRDQLGAVLDGIWDDEALEAASRRPAPRATARAANKAPGKGAGKPAARPGAKLAARAGTKPTSRFEARVEETGRERLAPRRALADPSVKLTRPARGGDSPRPLAPKAATGRPAGPRAAFPHTETAERFERRGLVDRATPEKAAAPAKGKVFRGKAAHDGLAAPAPAKPGLRPRSAEAPKGPAKGGAREAGPQRGNRSPAAPAGRGPQGKPPRPPKKPGAR